MKGSQEIFEAFLDVSGINRNYDLSIFSGSFSATKEYHMGFRRDRGLLNYDMVLLCEFVKNFAREEGLQIEYLAEGKVQVLKGDNKILEVTLEESREIRISCFDIEVFESLKFKMGIDVSCIKEKVGAEAIDYFIELFRGYASTSISKKEEANKIVGFFQKISKYMEDHKHERQPTYETNPDIIEACRFIVFLGKVLEKDKASLDNFMKNTAANSQDINHQALTKTFHYLTSYIDDREPEVSNDNNLTWAERERQRIAARSAVGVKQPD